MSNPPRPRDLTFVDRVQATLVWYRVDGHFGVERGEILSGVRIHLWNGALKDDLGDGLPGWGHTAFSLPDSPMTVSVEHGGLIGVVYIGERQPVALVRAEATSSDPHPHTTTTTTEETHS